LKKKVPYSVECDNISQQKKIKTKKVKKRVKNREEFNIFGYAKLAEDVIKTL